MENYISPIIWKYGRPAELWIRNEAFIKKFISTNKLQALSPESLAGIAPVAGGIIIEGRVLRSFAMEEVLGAETSRTMLKSSTKSKLPVKFPFPPFPFPGGIKGAHIHFQGEVYLLNGKQWEGFSSSIMKDIQNRIANAGSVNFEQVMEISEVMDSFPQV